MVVVKGTYDWLEEEYDPEKGREIEEYYSKFNCKYMINDEEKVEVACHIEQGPTVITHARSSGISKVLSDPPQDFNGVKGFQFVSELADPRMEPNQIREALMSEIATVFDFVRDPLSRQ